MKKAIRFVKDWALPLAMAMGTLLYLLFAFTPALEEISESMGVLMNTILPLFMFLVLFVTFCKVDFHRLRPVAWHLHITIANVVLIAVLMAVMLIGGPGSMSPSAKVLLEATFMCVAAPTATAAAVVTQKLGGDLEQMTAFTFISNFLTALLVPVCFPLIEADAGISFLTMSSKILYQVSALLVGPMLLAYLVKHYAHRLHRLITGVRDLSFYLWSCSLMIVTGTTVKNIVHARASVALLMAIAFTALLTCGVQFAIGRKLGRRSCHAQEAGQALGQKNTAFAIWMSITFLNPLSSVGPGCYILWQNAVNSIEIWQHERNHSKAELN